MRSSTLKLGDGGTIHNAEKLYSRLNVIRQTLSNWFSEADNGILLRNIDALVADLRLISGFPIGMRTLGDERGVKDGTLHLLHILNNRYSLDIRAEPASRPP